MAKYPVPGAVKTRLARWVGSDRSCALYRAFLLDIAGRFTRAPWEVVWAVDPSGSDFSSIAGARACQIDQEGSTLGERMRACFATLFAYGAERVVMIGGDAPHVADRTVEEAFAVLGDNDVTVVPSSDGGYCLVGLRTPADIFTPIEMGTSRVFDETRALVASSGLSLHVLAEGFDVDDLNDVEALGRCLKAGEVRLPHTAEVLAEWRRAGVLRDSNAEPEA